MNTDLPARFFSIGVAILMAAAWSSVPSISHPLGSDWGHYFTAAEFIWNPTQGLAYPDFRKPWFGWLIGGLGQGVGYLTAAQLIGKISLAVMVLGASLLGAAMASRWVGLVAGGTILLMPLAMDGALWVNHYPALGAAVGLAFGAGAAATRWRWFGWVLISALAAGVAWALDFRGLVALPAAAGLVLLGGLRLGIKICILRLLAFTAVFAGPYAQDAWLQQTFSVPQLEVSGQLAVQRKGTLEQIGQGLVGGDEVRRACAGQRVEHFQAAAATTACADALRDSSVSRLAALGLIPAGGVLGAGALWLLPSAPRRRWTMAVAGAGIVGAPMVSLYMGMGWVTYFDRYVLPFAVIIAAFLPVALARVADLMPVAWLRAPLGGLLALSATAILWPGLNARNLDAPETVRSSEYHAGVFADWATAVLGPDDGVIDCAGLAVDSLLLPRRIDYVRYPPGDPECVALIKAPTQRAGQTFLITMHRDLPPNSRPDALPYGVAAIAAQGWVEADHNLDVDGYRLWVRP